MLFSAPGGLPSSTNPPGDRAPRELPGEKRSTPDFVLPKMYSLGVVSMKRIENPRRSSWVSPRNRSSMNSSDDVIDPVPGMASNATPFPPEDSL
ncbi:MAG: hypothetical protein ACYTGZ_13990 [Planctomycetota bacterium]